MAATNLQFVKNTVSAKHNKMRRASTWGQTAQNYTHTQWSEGKRDGNRIGYAV